MKGSKEARLNKIQEAGRRPEIKLQDKGQNKKSHKTQIKKGK